MGHQQVALEPAGVVVAVKPHDQEHGVDVGGDDLLFGGFSGHLAREAAAPGQHGLDGGGRLTRRRPRRHPVAHRRQVLATLSLVPQPARMLGLQLATFGREPVNMVELDGDAGRDQSLGGVRRELPRPLGVPSQVVEIEAHSAVG